MKLEIQKIGDDLVLILPDELIRQLGWAQGDEVAVSVEGRDMRLAFSRSLHDRAMALAEEIMEEYKDALAELARS